MHNFRDLLRLFVVGTGYVYPLSSWLRRQDAIDEIPRDL